MKDPRVRALDEVPELHYRRIKQRSPGRPRKVRSLDATIDVHVSAWERKAIEQAAARAGYTVETWVLRLALREAGIEP